MSSKYFMSGAADAQNIPLLQMTDPNTADTIQNSFLSCSICYEVYNKPKCLPCLHTFCCSCLISYMKSQEVYGARQKKGFPCPVCKQFCSIKDPLGSWRQWADEFRDNFLIQNMIDTIVEKCDQGRTKTEDGTKEDGATKVGTPSAPPPALPSAPPPALSSAPPPALPSAPPASLSISMFRHRLGINQSPDSPDQPSGVSYGRQNSSSMPDLNQGGHTPADNTNAVSDFAYRYDTIVGFPSSNSSVSYTETRLRMNKTYEMAARNWSDYKPPRNCDICCLPKQNSVVVLDYDNRCMKFIKDVFLGRNVVTCSEMVVGRPCCVAIMNKATESRIVVSICNRPRLYFLSVPDLEVVYILETTRSYRGVAVLSQNTILAASPGEPTCIDLIKVNQSCRLVSCTTIYKNGSFGGSWNGDIYKPHYIEAMSDTMFAVSDDQRKSLVVFEIDRRQKAVKKFTLTPPEYRGLREPGGLCYHNGCMYIVDTANHEVLKVTFSPSVVCETVLKRRDGVYRPSSVCVGPRGELCVSNWEGKVTIFKECV